MRGTFTDEDILDRLLPIGLFASAIAVGLTPYGGLLNLAFTPLAFAVGLVLYFQRPLAYLSFTLWLWMLAPMIRRMSDFQGGFQPVSVILIAPLAVTMLGALSLVRYRRHLDGKVLLPAFVILAVVVYGFFRGALSGGLVPAALALANWSIPVFLGVHLLVLPEDASDKARAMLRALVFGGIVIGLYGIVQFVLLLPWDSYWMTESALASIGAPYPFYVRVFSTLNSPGPFAVFAGAASLAAFATQSRVRWAAMLLSIIALLLSLVRSTWGSWAICLLLLFFWAPKAQKTNYVIVAIAAILIVTPIIAVTPLGSTITDRITELSEGSSDDSYLERRRLYLEFTQTALTSVFGVGLGQTSATSTRLGSQADSDVTSIDSGILDAFYSLGLLASIFFGAIALMIIRAWPSQHNSFAMAAFIVAFINVPIMIFGNTFIAPSGILFYPFLALAIVLKADDIANTGRNADADA